MTAIIIIIIITLVCFILYKAGAVGGFLKLFRVATEPETTADKPPEISERQRLEADAGYILTKQGCNPDTMQYMSDEMLTAIIREYLTAAEIL